MAWDVARVGRPVNLLAGRWALAILAALENGPLRRRRLSLQLHGISEKVLTETLRRLEGSGLVQRTLIPEVPSHVEYALTDCSIALRPVLEALDDWAASHLA
jgi:DNA-binding HxlR family transcriptional regulator